MTNLLKQKTHVVVIGGGYAGTMAANHLRQRGDIEITLVNPRPVFVERIRLHQLVAGTGTATADFGTPCPPGTAIGALRSPICSSFGFTLTNAASCRPW